MTCSEFWAQRGTLEPGQAPSVTVLATMYKHMMECSSCRIVAMRLKRDDLDRETAEVMPKLVRALACDPELS